MSKIKETDRYVFNPHRQTILDSLAHIHYQSSRHLCVNTGVSVDDVLEVVDGDLEIGYKFTGGVTVYFLKNNEPKGALYNSGENSFIVKKKEESKPKRIWSKVTPETVEQCAFDGLTFEEAAERIGTSAGNLRGYYYSNRKPEIKEAWQRGKQRRLEAGFPLPDRRKKHKKSALEKVIHSTIPVTHSEDAAFSEIENRKQEDCPPSNKALEIRPKFNVGDLVTTNFDDAFFTNNVGIVSEISIKVKFIGVHIEYQVADVADGKVLTEFRLDESTLERF